MMPPRWDDSWDQTSMENTEVIVCFQNSYTEALTLHVVVFGDEAFGR